MRIIEVKFYICLALALTCICPANGQEILQKKKTEIQGKGLIGTDSKLINLFGKNYFTTGWGGHYRVYYGGNLYSGAISDTLIDQNKKDQFLFEFDSTLEIKDYYVIDNCEEYIAFTNTDTYGVLAVQFEDEDDADSLAVMTLPEGIQLKRSDYLDQSVLIVTDSNFNYIEHFVPTTGKILQLEGGHENLYMTIRIPLGKPYILVGLDTIFNKYLPSVGFWTSLVLASYNLETKSFNWSKWIGTTDLDYIYGLQMDKEENLILLVSTFAPIELPGEDTIDVSNLSTNCIVLKFDGNGDFQWGQNFNKASPYLYNLNVDEDGGIYLMGLMGTGQLLDTFLFVDNSSTSMLLKLESTGEFDWVYRVEGLYEHSSFHNLAFNNGSNELFLSVLISDGTFDLNGTNYVDSNEYSSSFILKIDKGNGNLKGHIISQEGLPVSFPQMTVDAAGNLIVYITLNDRIHFLGVELSPFEARFAGYLLRISSEWDSIVHTQELIPDLFKVYPNPVMMGQKLVLEIEQSYLIENMRGILVDAQGFIVQSFAMSEKLTALSTSDLASGVYSLCVYNDGVYKSELIMIQN